MHNYFHSIMVPSKSPLTLGKTFLMQAKKRPKLIQDPELSIILEISTF